MELLVEDIGVDGFVLRLLCEGDLVGDGLVGVHEAGAGFVASLFELLAAKQLVLRDGRGALGVHEGEVGSLADVVGFLTACEAVFVAFGEFAVHSVNGCYIFYFCHGGGKWLVVSIKNEELSSEYFLIPHS